MLDKIVQDYAKILRTAHENRRIRSAKTQKAVDKFKAAAVDLAVSVAIDLLCAQATSTKKGATMAKPTKPVKKPVKKPKC